MTCSNRRTRKTKHTSTTDVKPITAQSKASSVPLFIFTASQVLSKNHSGKFADGAGRRISKGEREYSITMGKVIRRFDSVLVSTSSRPGRAYCKLL